MTKARRLVPISEITPIAHFLKEIGKTWDNIQITDSSVTFSRLPEPPTYPMVPDTPKKVRTAYDDVFAAPTPQN